MNIGMSFSCIVCRCQSTPSLVMSTVKGDLHGRFRVVKCAECAHVQLNPPQYDLAFYEADGQVRNVVRSFGTPMATVLEHSALEARRRVSRFAMRGNGNELVGSSRVLDVGGGYGFFGSAVKKLHPEINVTVLEPSFPRLETGRKYFEDNSDEFPMPEMQTGILDGEYITVHEGEFDIVTLWHVLEHVADPTSLLRMASKLLRPSGSLWVEVPNLEDDLNEMSPFYKSRTFMLEHISYFTAETLEQVARAALPGGNIEVSGYQRYGILNYAHWVVMDEPQGAHPDMYPGYDRFRAETEWRKLKEKEMKSDALLMVVDF